MSGKHTHKPEPDDTLWLSLDEWEPAPITADFNRRLYARIGRYERSRIWRLSLRYVPAALVLIFTLFCTTLASRRAAQQAVNAEWTESEALLPDNATEGHALAQALSDLHMLTELQRRDSEL